MTQTIASDAFNGASYSLLTAHTADKGGTWQVNASTTSAQFYLYGGKTYCAAVQGSAGAAFYLPVAPISADYSVFADITIKTTTGHTGIAGRMSATENTMYLAYPDPSNVWVLAKRVGGLITTLDAIACPTSGTYAIELRMTGTSIEFYVGGVLKCGVTDGAITAAGYGGIRSGSAGGSASGKHLDNFRIVDASTAPVARAYTGGWVGL